MRRFDLALLVALVGCGSPGDGSRSENAAVDAPSPGDASTSADAPLDPIGSGRMPFMTTGTTPAGSLADVQYIAVEFIDGNCPGVYNLMLYRTDAPEEVPAVRFAIPIPPNATQPPTGTIMASAWAGNASTDHASFEIAQLDLPPEDESQPVTLRIAGRMTISMGAWNIDFTIDALTPRRVCLIL